MAEEDDFEISDTEDEIFQGFSESEIQEVHPYNIISGIVPEERSEMGNRSYTPSPHGEEAHSHDNEENSGSTGGEETFNEDLPAVHSYLGRNLSEVTGRMIYSELRYVTLPIISGHFGPLLPGQTFPLTIREPERLEIIKSVIQGDHTFGCVPESQPDDEECLYGTTAEIFEYSDDRGKIRIKAKGRQRFKLFTNKYTNRRPSIRIAQVLILPEVQLTHPFNALNYPSFNALRSTGKENCRKVQANFLAFPKWVYDMYDPEKLVEQADKLCFLKQGLRSEKGLQNIMPRDPTELSFWIASYLDSEKRLKMLKMNSPIPRLRWLLNFLSRTQQYICNNCDAFIGNQTDLFAMSIDGAQSTFVNSEGYHHDTVTLLQAENIVPITAPSAHFSWFPGYAWSIAVCKQCQKHLGWQFTECENKLKPSKFWGLTRNALDTRTITRETDEVGGIPRLPHI